MGQQGRWAKAAIKSDTEKELSAFTKLTGDVTDAYNAAVSEANDQGAFEQVMSIALPLLATAFFPGLAAMGTLGTAATYGALSAVGEFAGHELYDMSGWADDYNIDMSSYAPEDTYAGRINDELRGDGWGGESGDWVHGARSVEEMQSQIDALSSFVSDAKDYGADDFLGTMLSSSLTNFATQGANANKYDVAQGTEGYANASGYTIDPVSGNYLLDGNPATAGAVMGQDAARTNIFGKSFTPFQDMWDSAMDMNVEDPMGKMAYGQGINKFNWLEPTFNDAGALVNEGVWQMNPDYLDFMKQFAPQGNNLFKQIQKYGNLPLENI